MKSVAEIFGQNLADGLDTDQKQQAALGVYQMIEDGHGPEAAREWMISMNPTLNGAAPIRLIAWGCINEVAIAAHAYTKK